MIRSLQLPRNNDLTAMARSAWLVSRILIGGGILTGDFLVLLS